MLETPAERRQRYTNGVIAFILWAITAVLGVLNIVYIRLIALRTYLRFVPDGANALSLINILVMIFMAFFFVAAVIGGAEYHRTRYGSSESWRMFALVLALETAVVLLPIFL
ncbi:MAG: hypothetical protein AAF614_30430 [Chloroflexota bacterium]